MVAKSIRLSRAFQLMIVYQTEELLVFVLNASLALFSEIKQNK